MPKIKFSHVVSCSSEDPINPADNLLNSDPKKRFLCKNAGESSVSIILQFERTCRICSIDVGNANAAFVEIFAGRSSSKEQNYEIILPMSSFMTPMDAMNMTNTNRVRLFATDDLSDAQREKWDRVKVICTQPFNKNVQYGLTFLALNTKDEEDASSAPNLGKFTMRPESPNLLKAGSLFSKRKELNETPKPTIAQEIRQAVTVTPPSNNIKIKPGTSGRKVPDSEAEIKKQMNRNRPDLFYDSDDDKNTDRIDKIVEQVKQKTNETNDRKKQKTNETKKQTNATQTKRKSETNEQHSVKKRVKTIQKPFNELLSDVVFTISGFVNPERGNIRESGLNMGAKFRKDWDATCTHLICAFANTPKFQQVRGKGKIVKKEWLYDCNTQRKRLPWRRYALDKNDASKAESEDEICEKTNETTDYLSGSDTDEEIEKIIKQQKNEVFDVETDEEQLEKNAKKVADVPKLFKTEIFYIDSCFSDHETDKLERLIKSFNGVVIKRISSIIDFVVTNRDSVENIKNDVPSATFVTKEWIFDCHDQLALVPYEKYVLM